MISYIMSQRVVVMFYLDCLLKIDIPVIATVFFITTPLGNSYFSVFSILVISNYAKYFLNMPISEHEVILSVCTSAIE
jgi:hypothetical protein